MAKSIWTGVALLIGLNACSSGSKMVLPTEQERFSQIYFDSGNGALFAQKYSEALAAFLEAVKYNPKSVDAWNNLGLAYYGMREVQKAKDSWLRVLTINPKYSEAKTNLGALYLEQNKLVEAEQYFKEVLRDLVYTKLHLAHFNLAKIYFKQGKNLSAEEQLNLAVKSNRYFCGAWSQLGELAYRRGEFAIAAEHYKNATNGTCYNYPEAHYRIGETLLRTGEKLSAKAKFVEIIKNFSSTEWAVKAEAKLSLLATEPK
jgi:type IV pilus assembly protein PilF